MKVPPKRKGNSTVWMCWDGGSESLNESPSEKEGKFRLPRIDRLSSSCPLNESPSEKEGKFLPEPRRPILVQPSMKVPPKRKGNWQVEDFPHPCPTLNESPSEKEGKSRDLLEELTEHFAPQ